jgi:prepilin-type N-terminal cleavage/methylation domain-containing protein
MFRRAGGAARYGGVRRRTGFTLVEVIVVLVILAILAAIAIPALTGYIDKAKWRSFESEIHTARTAAQTLIIEELSENGGAIRTYTDSSGHFTSVGIANSWETDPANRMYTFGITTPADMEEYKKLTGSTANIDWLSVTTDSGGAILMVQLTYLAYYETLVDLNTTWAIDFSAADPLGEYIDYQKSVGSNVFKQLFAGLSPGFTCWKLAWKADVVGPSAGAERVY